MSSLINRQNVTVALLFLALVVASFFFDTPTPAIPYDPNSISPQGAAALRLWLDDMGYDVDQTGEQTFDLGRGESEADLLFVFPNVQLYTSDEADRLLTWVESGGTLVLMGPSVQEFALVDAFGVHTIFGGLFMRDDEQKQPILPDADARNERISDATLLYLGDVPAALSVLGVSDKNGERADDETGDSTAENSESIGELVENGSTVAVQARGEGTVWHVTSRYEPVNILLREPEVAQLVGAFLRTVPADGTILFDTYHLFGADADVDNTIRSVNDWLTRSAPGRATIFAGLLTLVYLFFQGRRLGPALPLSTLPKRREAAEYVEAMAGLHRRSNQRNAVADHHKQRLKIALGKRLHIDPNLMDATFIERLQIADHKLSPEELTAITKLIQDLANNPSEDALIELVSNVDGTVKNF